MEEFTEREKYAMRRKKKGLTLNQVGEFVGVTYSILSRYERGKHTPRSEVIRRYKYYIDSYNGGE